jgi:hypothetical protein
MIAVVGKFVVFRTGGDNLQWRILRNDKLAPLKYVDAIMDNGRIFAISKPRGEFIVGISNFILLSQVQHLAYPISAVPSNKRHFLALKLQRYVNCPLWHPHTFMVQGCHFLISSIVCHPHPF